MERVVRIRVSSLKYGSSGLTQASREALSASDDDVSSEKPWCERERCSVSNAPGSGGGCRRSMAQSGNARVISAATEMLASSMNSSTIELASLSSYMPTSVISADSSILKRTSGDRSVSAPAALRAALSFFARLLSIRSDRVSSSSSRASSSLACASAYESAASEQMTLLTNLVETTLASASSSQMTEKASRSTFWWSEQRSSPSRLGTMSIRRSTR
mmetsp:Transcript_32225/g.70592  ORF Transcript_32225/g.70592 Transcript_32225/m.70592 type:complete len:217 (-) Transcript_32225:2626-3276(-)